MQAMKISAPNQEPTVQAPQPTSFRQRLIHALRGWRRRVTKHRRAGNDALQLRGMSDHELCDLGIGRSEVQALLDPHRF